MRRLLFVLAAVLLAGCGSSARKSLTVDDQEPLRAVMAPSATGKCGVERWPVKVLTDPAAASVDLTAVVRTNVPALVSRPNTGPTARQSPTETTLFQLTGVHIVEFKLEGDSDIHLVLRSVISPNPTMIAEIPDPACGTGSRVLSQITAARSAFLAHVASKGLTLSTSFQQVDWPVVLQGVGFFDFPHGQTGLAANDIELHPILLVRFL